MNYEYYKKYCKDIENVENYEKALADNFKGWIVHHRLETHNSDGERRLVDIKHKELKALGMYYNRPASELIFLTRREHNSLHHKGKQPWNKGRACSEEARKKISEANRGKHLSEETKRKISETLKNRPDEVRKKMSEGMKDKHWFNNGKMCVRSRECPEGFVPGRLSN